MGRTQKKQIRKRSNQKSNTRRIRSTRRRIRSSRRRIRSSRRIRSTRRRIRSSRRRTRIKRIFSQKGGEFELWSPIGETFLTITDSTFNFIKLIDRFFTRNGLNEYVNSLRFLMYLIQQVGDIKVGDIKAQLKKDTEDFEIKYKSQNSTGFTDAILIRVINHEKSQVYEDNKILHHACFDIDAFAKNLMTSAPTAVAIRNQKSTQTKLLGEIL